MIHLKSRLPVLALVFLLFILVVLSFLFGKSFGQIKNPSIQSMDLKEETPSKKGYDPLPLDINFDIPNGFKVQSIQSGSVADPRTTYVNIRSNDYVLSHTDFGYPFISSGAEFGVSVSKAVDSDVEAYLNKSPLFQKIATEKIIKEIEGLKVIQHDMSWEGTNNTSAAFIKEGYVYSISYRYKDLNSKPQYIKEFGIFLNSLIKESRQSKY